MVQLNLLPDVKLEYLRSTRQRRLVIGISLIVAAASVAVVVILAGIVYGLQRQNLNDLNDDIKMYSGQLSDKPDLDKVLTVQNQLGSLAALHDQKPVASRLFNYLAQMTPVNAGISQIDVNFTDKQMTITGAANGLDVANTYVDTLKFTKYQKTGENAGPETKAFSNVVLSQFSRNDEGANFTIALSYDEALFQSSADVKLIVPKIISTRSVTERPTNLFREQTVQPGVGR